MLGRAYVGHMGEERDEIYERIPWESIERPAGDRRWLVYAVAGAITLGSLTYSFVSRPVLAPRAPATTVVSSAVPSTEVAPGPVEESMSGEQVPPPMVMSEADLMAVEPDALVELTVAHAEWFAYEYMAFDGSDRSSELLRSMLPADIPVPESPSGNQVWVDWARAKEVTQLQSSLVEVVVIVRSLLSAPGGEFERLPTRELSLLVGIDGNGEPFISSAPVVAEVVGGAAAAGWGEVEMVAGIDGVLRPQMPAGDQP